MEVLFENEFVRNKELANEFCGYYYFRRPLRIVLFALWCLALLLDAYRIITFGTTPLVTSWIILAFLVGVVIGHFRSVKLFLQRDAELYGDKVLARKVITEESIQTYNPDGTSEFKLENIKGWIDTKHYLLLYTRTRMVFFIRKDGFSKGSLEEFCAFLAGKGIKRRHML